MFCDVEGIKEEVKRFFDFTKEGSIVKIIIKTLKINIYYRIIIEDAIARHITIEILYVNAGVASTFHEAEKYLKGLDQKYIKLYEYDNKIDKLDYDFNFFVNEDTILYTSLLELDPFYKKKLWFDKIYKLKDNEKYNNIYQNYVSMVQKSKLKIGSINIRESEIENIRRIHYIGENQLKINSEPNYNDNFFSLCRNTKNNRIISVLDSNHIGAVWMTTKDYAIKYSKKKGIREFLWVEFPDSMEIPYPADIIIKKFKEHISGNANEGSLKMLDGKIVVMLIRLDYEKKIDEDLIIVVPNGFYYGPYNGANHIYFKKGEILHRIKLKELYANKEFEWIRREYSGRIFIDFINFYYENKKKLNMII